jgi:hypothetical protein
MYSFLTLFQLVFSFSYSYGYSLNNGTWGAPYGGWNLANYLAGSQKLGPYPVAIPSIYDQNNDPNLPGWGEFLITNSSIFQPLPNQGCPPSVHSIDCVDYLSNGGLYPNCNPNMYGFSCGLPMSKNCMIANTNFDEMFNLSFVPNPNSRWNRFVATNYVSFILQTPTIQQWYNKFANTNVLHPTELFFPIRWGSISRKVIALKQTAFIQEQIKNMINNPASSGEWEMSDIIKYNISYAWWLNGVKQIPFMKYITPSSITNPDNSNYSNRLFGLVLKLPFFPLEGKNYTIDISALAWILTWNSLPNIDYSFSNSDTYCSVQTVALGPHCLRTGPGTQCFVDDLVPGTYCRTINGQVMCFQM